MKESHELTKPSLKMRALAPVEIVAPAPPSPAAQSSNGYGEVSIDEELGLRNYWRAVRKRLWLILLLTMMVTLATAVYMARQPDAYEAYARVQVDAERGNPAVNPTKTDVLTFNDPTYFSTQLQILSSSGLLRRVVKALDLEHNQAFLHPQPARTFWQNILQTFGLGKAKRSSSDAPKIAGTETLKITPAPATQQEDLMEATQLAPYVEALQNGLEIEPVKDNRLKVTETRLIDIRFRHPDPQIAAKVVNAIADTFLLSNLEMKTETNTTTGDFLQRRIAELQTQIRTDEERLVNYARNNQILSLDASQNTVVERLAGLNRQLLEAENERKAAEAAYRAALLPGAAEAQAAESQRQIDALETKLAELKQKRAQLLVEVTEEWPEVKEVNQQITVLEKQIEETRASAATNVKINLETRYRQALAREQSLRTAFDQQRGETLAQNEAAINYRIIQQEIETSKNLLNGLLQRSKENEVVLAGTSSNIHIIDHAIVPRSPVGPHRLLMVALAFTLGLSFSIGFALVLERFNNTLRSTDEVEQLLRLPALVAVPTVSALKGRRPLALKGASSSLSLKGNGNGNGNGNGHGRPELLINSGVHSPLAEAYRHLRTSILLSTPGGGLNTLLVTSSQPSEGKTTTAANIAVSLAQTGVNVLLIDADLRRPQMHKIFHVENDRGLSTLLSKGAAAPEVLMLIKRHKASGLHILPSGPATPSAAELLGSDQMRQLLTFLQTIFTYIIIDSPPVTSFTDGVLISSMTDGVLFVVQWGKSPREIARRARQVLQEAGARIIGVVLNNVDPKTGDENYYDRYYAAADEDEMFEADESSVAGK